MEPLAGYLSGKGIRTWPAAGNEITAHCFFLCESDKGKGRLYLNSESWRWTCFRCGTSGGRRALLEHFGDVDDVSYLPGSDPGVRMRLLTDYTDHAADLLQANQGKLNYLTSRGLEVQTIVDAKLGFVPRGYGVCHSLERGRYTEADFEATGLLTARGTEFHSGRIVIPYLHHDRVLQIRGKQLEGKYFTPPGEQVRLYNADSLRGAKNVLITEGEFDALITAQTVRGNPDSANQDLAVVGLPGAGAWPGGKDGFASYLREAKRVYIGLDPDSTGIREAEKLKSLLGSTARIVTLPSDDGMVDKAGRAVKCDWSAYLSPATADNPWGGHGAQDVDDLLNTASMVGKRVFSIAEAAAKWRADKLERPGLKLGYPSLDSIISPGLRPGNVAVVLAKTGAGKTVFLANVDYNTRDRRVLHVTLENSVSEIFELLWRIHHFWNPGASEFAIERDMPLLRIVDENRLSGAALDELIEEYTEDVGAPPELLLLDYLGYFAAGQRGGGAYEKVSAAVMELKAAAKRNGLAILTPHQVSRGQQEGVSFDGDEARDSGVVEESSDFMLGLYRPGDAADKVRLKNEGSVTRDMNIQIIKSRRGGKGKIARLAMSHASLTIVDTCDPVALTRVTQETEAMNRPGFTYAQLRRDNRDVALRRAQMRLLP